MKVLNNKKCSREERENSVYIGRNSKYWKLEDIDYFNVKYSNRFYENISKYVEDLKENYSVEEIRKDLKGKDLLCWCYPNFCHGLILKEICENDEKFGNNEW